MLRPARKLPEVQGFGGRESIYAADLREFMRSNMQVAIVEVKGKEAKKIVQNIQVDLRKHSDEFPGIACTMRRDSGGTPHAYLYRVEVEQ